MTVSIRQLLQLLVGVLLAAACQIARADPPPGPPALVLQDAAARLAVWPAVRTLGDSSLADRSPQELIAHPEWFVRPRVPEANFGVLRHALWLRIPVEVPPSDQGRWLFDAGFPTLDRIDLHVFTNGRLTQSHLTGDQMPLDARPSPSRTMAIPLTLAPGERHELLVRVRTEGSTLLPIVLHRQSAYPLHETRFQLIQGLLAGIGLCLIAYSLLNWALTRDPMFLDYAICLIGVTGFFVAFHGLGSQYLWPQSPWLMRNGPLLFAQIGLFGSCLFADRTLHIRRDHPRASMLLRGLAALSAGLMVGLGTGWLPYSVVHATVNLVGVLPMLVAVPVAVQRTRDGDLAAFFMLLGWSFYAIGVLSIALLLRGFTSVSPLTQHTFQTSSLFEMVMWMAALGHRNAQIRNAAEHAERERKRMSSLAQADPLTGLANRRGLQGQARRIIEAASIGSPAAVIMVDLDGFKPINDQHGHDAGDQLLIAVAARLRDCVRGTDCVARTGGDEFVLVLSDLIDERDAQAIASKIEVALRAPFAIADLNHGIGATIGYAVAPHDGIDWQDLLKKADQAMYAGKARGKGKIGRAADGHRERVDLAT